MVLPRKVFVEFVWELLIGNENIGNQVEKQMGNDTDYGGVSRCIGLFRIKMLGL